MATATNTKEILLAVAGSGVVLVAAVKLIRCIFSEEKKDYPKDVVILFQPPQHPKTSTLSPFAAKLEMYLRMAKIPYQNEYSLKMSPKHKTPWIMFNGQVISDTQFIIEFLNKKFDIDLSKHLTSKEKAVAHAMRKMAEESLYWIFALSLWVHDYDRSFILKRILVSKCILWKIKSAVKRQTYCQGYGRHTREEVENLCRRDLQALSDQIGRNLFLMGNQPCETDCAIFALVAMLRNMPENSFVTKIMKDNVYPNLTTYYEKMKKAFWPDY
ncbi:unnamed protein product [Acanthosepion pharaonis]|uniref:Failed axon connections homolog n=1 Tax=Acanthosepion pharaonis TaxID=158019 RepID=A0A812E471_ACAPH|nr:unnamed protein product [Sepia pharaonis]